MIFAPYPRFILTVKNENGWPRLFAQKNLSEEHFRKFSEKTFNPSRYFCTSPTVFSQKKVGRSFKNCLPCMRKFSLELPGDVRLGLHAVHAAIVCRPFSPPPAFRRRSGNPESKSRCQSQCSLQISAVLFLPRGENFGVRAVFDARREEHLLPGAQSLGPEKRALFRRRTWNPESKSRSQSQCSLQINAVFILTTRGELWGPCRV